MWKCGWKYDMINRAYMSSHFLGGHARIQSGRRYVLGMTLYHYHLSLQMKICFAFQMLTGGRVISFLNEGRPRVLSPCEELLSCQTHHDFAGQTKSPRRKQIRACMEMCLRIRSATLFLHLLVRWGYEGQVYGEGAGWGLVMQRKLSYKNVEDW